MEVGSAGALRPGDPERLGDYTISGRLGEGGQGTVYLGRADDGEPVAIKLLHQDLTGNERARSRFLREVEVAKQVRSFCTARIVEVAVEGEQPYIVSEYVEGPSLRAQIEDEGPLSGGALERLAIGTATALVVIHRAGVVHRDLKPANVLLGPDGPRVIDFGIAKPLDSATTVSSRVLGTPAFMAPEQLRGAGASRAADVFAWASTMVYAATGQPPFGQDTIPAVVNRILHEEPDLSGVQEPLRSLLARCLDKDPKRRPDAQRALMSLLGQEDAAVPPTVVDPPDGATEELVAAALSGGADVTVPSAARTPLRERLRGLSRRQWLLGGGVAAALVAVAISLGLAVMLRNGDATQAGNRTPPRPAPTSTSSTPSTQQQPVESPSYSEPSQEPSYTDNPSEEPSPTDTGGYDTPYNPVPTHSHSSKPSKKPSDKPTEPTTGPSGNDDSSSD